MASLAAMVLAAWTFQDDPADPETLLRRRFPGVDPAVLTAAADRIRAALIRSPDSRRAEAIAHALPSAVEYHALVATAHELTSPDARIDPALVQEGVSIQLDYLSARVEEAARFSPTAGDRAAVEVQLGVLAHELRTTLSERLTGPAADPWIRQRVQEIENGWKASLDDPLSAFLERPLNAAELASVQDQIRRSAREFPPLVLTPEDVSNRDRMAAAGALRLLEDALEASYLACRFGLEGLAELDRRESDWLSRREEALRRVLRENPPPPLPLPTLLEEKLGPLRARRGPLPRSDRPDPAAARSGSPPPAPPPADRSGRAGALVGAALLLLVAAAGFLSRRAAADSSR